MTGAGQELLGRAKVVLDEAAAAAAAVRRTAAGETGTARLFITPPVAPMLAQHLEDAAREHLPGVAVTVQRMWLPNLVAALADGTTDVAITCARLPDAPGVVSAVFCSEALFVGLRPDHPLAASPEVALEDLARHRRAVPSDALFPALALAQRQALDSVDLHPPEVVLDATDLSASGWTNQPEATWGSAHRVAGHATADHRSADQPGTAHPVHPAMESRTGADRRGRPLRPTGPYPGAAVGLASGTRSSALPQLTPAATSIDRRGRSV